MKNSATIKGLKFWLSWIFPVFIVIAIQIFSSSEDWVETSYSIKLYPHIGSLLRKITGKIPFSIGEIFYSIVVISLFIQFIRFFISFKKYAFPREWFSVQVKSFFKGIKTVLWVYIIFMLIWGLNYSRSGIESQLKYQAKNYCKEEVSSLLDKLIIKANEIRKLFPDSSLPIINIDAVKQEAVQSYHQIESTYSFLHYQNTSIKKSIFTPLGSYFGFTGYYNPFSGEAHYRSDIPTILQPFVVCHEMAHQLGYASETEANFVSYLVTSNSNNMYFKYSVLLELISDAQHEQLNKYLEDDDWNNCKEKMKQQKILMDTLVKKDRRTIRSFFQKKENKISPIMNVVYDSYLKANNQSDGIESYDKVIAWILAEGKL